MASSRFFAGGFQISDFFVLPLNDDFAAKLNKVLTRTQRPDRIGRGHDNERRNPYPNKFTKKGFGGIKDHFTHDMFEGFFGERGAKLVSGGRYRPLSMVSLTLEYEISRRLKGDKRESINDKNLIMGDQDPYLFPPLNHIINILLS